MFLDVLQVGVVDGIEPPGTAVGPLDGGDLLGCVSYERHLGFLYFSPGLASPRPEAIVARSGNVNHKEKRERGWREAGERLVRD